MFWYSLCVVLVSLAAEENPSVVVVADTLSSWDASKLLLRRGATCSKLLRACTGSLLDSTASSALVASSLKPPRSSAAAFTMVEENARGRLAYSSKTRRNWAHEFVRRASLHHHHHHETGGRSSSCAKSAGLTLPSAAPLIVVIDTGADLRHPELSHLQRHWNASSMCTEEHPDHANGCRTDDHDGHGTAVLSVLAGAQCGVLADDDCFRVVPVRLSEDLRVFELAQAIAWAVEANASIVSISIVFQRQSHVMTRALRLAQQAGVTVIAAAGNCDWGCEIAWPAADRSVVAVGALTREGRLASWSSRRPPIADPARTLDIAAPGEAVPAAALQQHEMQQHQSGTSFAAPLVAGLVATIGAAEDDVAVALRALLSSRSATTLAVDTCAALRTLNSSSVCGGKETSPPRTGGADSNTNDQHDGRWAWIAATTVVLVVVGVVLCSPRNRKEQRSKGSVLL